MRRFFALQIAGLILLLAAVLAVDVLSTHLERQRLLAPQRQVILQLRDAGGDPCRDPRYVCNPHVPQRIRIPGMDELVIGWREGAPLMRVVDEAARQRRSVLLAVVLFIWLGIIVVPELVRQFRLRRMVAGVLDPQVAAPPDALQSAFSGTVRELVDARRRLVAAERLETMGLFAGGIAHQIGNPLAALRQYVDLLAGSVAEGDPPDPEIVARIVDLSERMDRAVAALARLSRPDRVELVAVALRPLVERVVAAVERGAVVAWTIEIPDDATVVADPVLLEQVLVNLLRNAIEAQDIPVVRICAAQDDRHWRLTIEDDGPGFPSGFDPAAAFATSKVGGTGLGLPLALRLLELMHSQAIFEHSPAGGRVSLILPAATEGAAVH
ncbi:MAG: sensor histidine kinase [Candidatus Dadabacteria bacterium]|nr:MAG: sensor histidine kinase [Candidatus Dadabacteria bacterium]